MRLAPVPRFVVATAMALAMASSARTSLAQRQARETRATTDEDLASARKLFAEAVADEDASRYDTALEKFRRVEAVKDTANVRYRIATCLEALGRRAEALTNYQAAVTLAEGDKGAADAARESSTRAAHLDHIVPHLSIVVPAGAPPDTRVRVDDQPIEANALNGPILLDPGLHTIAADAAGRTPYRTGVKLGEGGTVTITLALDPLAPAGGAGGGDASAAGGAATRDDSQAPAGADLASGSPQSRGSPALAYGLLGLGGALAAGSIAAFVLRESNLGTLNTDCASPPAPAPPAGMLKCPQGKANEVNGARSAASLEGPLGWGLAAGAAGALGVGAWLLLRPQPAQSAGGVHVTPVVSASGAMLVVTGPMPR